MRYQCASSALIAIEAWVLCCARSLRAALQTAHPQFHCGTPPPAAAPRTTTRSMIRLLEIPNASKVDAGMITIPRLETCHPEVHLKPRRKAVALAYLRAAHAYMLISMPTGTSTIFGVFQAILALSFFNFFSLTESAL